MKRISKNTFPDDPEADRDSGDSQEPIRHSDANMQRAVVKIVEGKHAGPLSARRSDSATSNCRLFAEGSPVHLSYEYNANQVLEVAVEAAGNRTQVSIERNTGLARDEMNRQRPGWGR